MTCSPGTKTRETGRMERFSLSFSSAGKTFYDLFNTLSCTYWLRRYLSVYLSEQRANFSILASSFPLLLCSSYLSLVPAHYFDTFSRAFFHLFLQPTIQPSLLEPHMSCYFSPLPRQAMHQPRTTTSSADPQKPHVLAAPIEACT